MTTAVAEQSQGLVGRYTPLAVVARALHRSTDTVLDLARAGKLPVPIKMGKKVLFRTDALMRSLEALEAEAEAAVQAVIGKAV